MVGLFASCLSDAVVMLVADAVAINIGMCLNLSLLMESQTEIMQQRWDYLNFLCLHSVSNIA